VNLCGELGKPQKLTMRYTGDGPDATSHAQDAGKVEVTGDPQDASPVRILASSKSDPTNRKAKTWCDETVSLGDTVEIDATKAGASRLAGDTYVFVYSPGGELLQSVRFHTSCSQPLRIGDQFGSLELLGFVSESGGSASSGSGAGGDDDYGDDADEPTGPEIAVGGTVVWTYVVTNPGDVPLESIVVTDDNETPEDASDDFHPAAIEENGVNVGDADGDGQLDHGEQWLYRAQDTVTEAGQHRNVGAVVGTPVGGGPEVRDSDPSHHIAPAPQVNLCGELGKPKVLTMRYTGQGPEATSHAQDPKKVSVVGDPKGELNVRILASSKSDPANKKAKVWFNGTVTLGDTFDIDAGNAGASRLAGDTYVFVYKLDGTLLQSVRFHTSCSQPLRIGDQFGSLEIVGFVSEAGSSMGAAAAAAERQPATCEVLFGEATAKRRTLSFGVSNCTSETITLTRIIAAWPAANGRLKKIRLGSRTILDKVRLSPPVEIASGWRGSDADRSIACGGTKTLTFEFESNASADLSGYDIQVGFQGESGTDF
jgi:hypothetical protein